MSDPTRAVTISLTLAAAVLATLPAAAQAPSSSAKAETKYTPAKTPWGDPDLQGIWPAATMIPLQRRAAAPLQTGAPRRRNTGTGPQRPDDVGPAAKLPPQDALIVDPPDGRIPAVTAEGAKRRTEFRDGRGVPAEWREEADEPSDMNLYYRCITRGVLGSILASSYNNGNHIVQTPGYVILRHEMIHETRVIPLDGRPHVGAPIRMYMGDSRGHWEGNTLVVETTNMTDKTSVGSNGAGYNGEGGIHSEALKLTERFTRTAPNVLQYTATLDDPKTWSKPWTITFPMAEDKEYFFGEYACHEGNYAMENILTGFRQQEELKEKK